MSEETQHSRPSWDQYFLNIAKEVSTRSVCYRAHCGAVIVKNKVIISTGYNGAPRYQKNCYEIGFCYRNKNQIKSGTQLECCRAVGCHSESNAIALAAKAGNPTDGATIYIYGNTAICAQCRGMIANAGILRVVYMDKDGKITEIDPMLEWGTHPVDMPTPVKMVYIRYPPIDPPSPPNENRN